MEVHHHSHPSTSSGHRKKWTHYFWEFLMLFLAVFCGFWAENVREHKVEHLRAKEFARSMVKDLQNDTAAIEFYRKTANHYMAVCDTLLNISQYPLEGTNATKFAFYTRLTYWTAGVAWNRTTFDQIKNSGSLRYFKHRLLEKLMKYDAVINDMEREFFNHETRGNDLLFTINKLIDPHYHQQVSTIYLRSFDTVSKTTIQHFLSVATPSLENKRELVHELLNMIVVQQRNLRIGKTILLEADRLARELIIDFSKEYHLK